MSFDKMNLNGYTQVEKALAMLNDLYSQYNSEISYAEYSQLHDAISSICEVEGTNVKPVVRGEWMYDEQPVIGNPYGSYVCSNCGNRIPHREHFDPHCGADMRERSETNERNL